ncbi:MAG TPA: transglycosylase domain-containing protein [Actinomycetota bacterium]|nr:transglycosylase domain-containing protein [Actinomycetota bacterium]
MNRRFFPLAAVAVAGAVLSAACGVHLEEYPRRQLAQTSFVYAADDSTITELHAVEDRVVLPTSRIPTWIRDAVVAIEDRRFYLHHGIDGRAILRATYVNLRDGSIEEGGSTITQQLVKNVYTGADRTVGRKLSEAVLAWQLEDRLSKDEILTRYLNTVYFGKGAYGVQAAARTFFGIDAKDLDLARSALLAGLITSPGHFDPYEHPRRARGRRGVVLRLMEEFGMISAAQRRHAGSRPIRLDQVTALGRYDYPYFVDYLKEWFLSNPAFGETREDRYRLLFTGGLRIHTTIRPGVQAAAQRAVDSVLSYPDDPSAAVTVLDPRDGFVLAMVGGDEQDYWRDRAPGRVNLATAAGGSGRQSGSAFKPFALVAALEEGMSASETFSAPSSLLLPLETGEIWEVTNAEGTGFGTMTLRSATVHSVNTVYAQVIDRLGPETVIEVAERMGLRCCRRVSNPRRPLRPYLSAVLGTNEVNTLEMASAYGTLATGGLHAQPVPVSRITDARGEVIWEADAAPKRVLDPQVTAVANGILNEAVLFGTGTAANIGRPQIGKTGTAMDHSDAWFVGAIPQMVAAVWIGFPRGQVRMEPPRTRTTVYGGTWPAQIWRLLMLEAARGLPVDEFPEPEIGFVSVAVDATQEPYCLPNPFTLPQNIQTMEFLVGTEPRTLCTSPSSLQKVSIPSTIGLTEPLAIEGLTDAGFYVDVRAAPSTQPTGTVIAQEPSAGTEAFQTSTVTITIAWTPIEEDEADP